MKVQYFGDVNDYRKYALLRLLAKAGTFRIGVCWMMTEPDAKGDGGKRSYLGQAKKWRDFDPELFDLLATVSSSPGSTELLRIESEGLIPGALFYNPTTPDQLAARLAFHRACLSAFAERELVFFDPDNGLDVPSRRKGRKDSSKYVYIDEIAEHYAARRSILTYQHYPREHRRKFLAKMARRLLDELQAATIWYFKTAHVVFVLAARPEHAHRVRIVAAQAAHNWPPIFVEPHPHESF